MAPVTPPRQHRRTTQTLTPTTPHFTSPKKHPSRTPKSQAKSPVSHLRTPCFTPRHRRKTSKTLADGFLMQPVRALFPPTPSSVGSGRIKDCLRVKVDDSPENRLLGKKRLEFNGMEPAPSTPTGAMITNEMKTKWVEQIPECSSDGEEGDIIKEAKVFNPFLSQEEPKEFVLKRPSEPLNKVEFVNKKGQKIIKAAGRLDDDAEFDLLGSKSQKKRVTVYNDYD